MTGLWIIALLVMVRPFHGRIGLALDGQTYSKQSTLGQGPAKSACDMTGKKGWGAEHMDMFIEKTSRVVYNLPVQPTRVSNAPDPNLKVAVLIEPRKHSCINYVIRNVLHFLGTGWALQIFHGTGNLQYITELLLDTDNGTSIVFTSVERDNFNTMQEYSQYVASPAFWEKVVGEHVFMFQTDSILLRSGVDQFLDYDYIGAPFAWCREVPHWPTNTLFGQRGEKAWCWNGGNGGLSFRKRSKMLEVAQRFPYPQGFPTDPSSYNFSNPLEKHMYDQKPEDVYFILNLPKVGGKLAPHEAEYTFALEWIEWGRSIPQTNTLGIHKAWTSLITSRMVELLTPAENGLMALATRYI